MLSSSLYFFFVDSIEIFIYQTIPSIFILKDQNRYNNRIKEGENINLEGK